MVNDAGQLYTMEGVAAGLIMLLAAYIVVGTTGIYTTADTGVPDMQLEQLGDDVLAMMDTPDGAGSENQLVEFVRYNNATGFEEMFLEYCNAMTNGAHDNLHMSAGIIYRSDGGIKEHPFVTDETWTGRESAVRVTRWVQLEGEPENGLPGDMRSPRAVLVEVLLWRA